MRRRGRMEEQENPDRWVVSYADFITLLFAFFTVMYAISRVDSAKLGQFVGSTRAAFGPRTPQKAEPVIEGIAPVTPGGERMRREAVRMIEMSGAAGVVSVRPDDRGIVLSMGEQALFDAARADVKPTAYNALAAVAAILRKAQCDAVVEGHTDSLPISTARYASNWELSSARATGVLARLLGDHGVPPERLSAAGYAEYRPVATNATPEGRGRNRRVDVVLLLEGAEGGAR
ncbi:MAG: OmpA family protein [Deltaproteobacteria bacterium]|nr:OmpA family protein [Deltaproteobacteria bacterium]